MTRWLRIMAAAAFFFTATSAAFAQNVTFETRAPAMVSMGRMFQVEYVSNVEPDRFMAPASFGDFEIVAGPVSSRSENHSFINGRLTSTREISTIYTLRASSPGTFSIPGARIEVDGKEYSTRAVPIEVVDEGIAQQGQQGQTQGGAAASPGQGTEIDEDAILLRAVVDKTSVYKGEPVRVSFKLYYREGLNIESPKLPAFNGFWPQELSVAQYRPQKETYNSKVYDTQIIAEYLLYPLQAGALQIEQLELTAVVQRVVQSRSNDPFDIFFGGGPEIVALNKRVNSQPVRITVKELPTGAPASFNGAVGDFTMTTDVPSGDVSANSSITYTVRIQGNGNLPLIQAPKLTVPTSFEQYNVKTTTNHNNNASGITGYSLFEYPIIPRAEGEFTISPVEFSYFSPASERYVNLASESVRVRVLPDSSGRRTATGGIVSGISKEELKILGQDIRFIKTGSSGVKPIGGTFVCSLGYFGLLLLMLGLFVFLLIYLRKVIRERRDANLIRGKRANKVALQRLRAAGDYMREDNQRKFYDEMLKALWGYMSDKLNIPMASLTKENVREELLKRGISAERIGAYIDLISECEQAQYAPGESGHMHDIYRSAIDIISKFESVMKR